MFKTITKLLRTDLDTTVGLDTKDRYLCAIGIIRHIYRTKK